MTYRSHRVNPRPVVEAPEPSAITPETKPSQVFETETCGRCGGGGSYSFNLMDGDMCYGCHGTGVRYTKRGRAALNLYKAIRTLPVELVEVGDRILDEGSGWRTVEAVEPNRSSGNIYPLDHPAIDEALERGDYVTLYEGVFDNAGQAAVVYGGVNIETPKVTLCGQRGGVVVALTDSAVKLAALRTIAEFQLSLTKAGKPRKDSRFAQEVAA